MCCIQDSQRRKSMKRIVQEQKKKIYLLRLLIIEILKIDLNEKVKFKNLKKIIIK